LPPFFTALLAKRQMHRYNCNADVNVGHGGHSLNAGIFAVEG
jgi:hypothetical protein